MDESLSGGPPKRLTRRRQSRAVAVMVVLAVLAGGVLAAQRALSRPERRASATASVIPAPVGTVRIAAMPPRGCTAREVKRLVEVFVKAFNSGNRVSLGRLWAQEGDGFDWYTADAPGSRTGAQAQDRAGLGPYFARRHAQGEQWRLTSFRYNGVSASYGNFEYTLVRQANDLRPTPYAGKGAAICSPALALGVWSMARSAD